MKLYEILKKLNKKSTIRFDRCVDLKQYYMAMYRNYMVVLYDRGYIDDPTVWEDAQFYKNIVDMEIKGLIDISGKVNLSEDFLSYAIDKSVTTEQQDFLTLVYNASRYRAYCNSLDTFYEEFKTKGVSLKLQMDGAEVYSRSATSINRGSLASICNKENKVRVYKLNEVIWNLAMMELKIDNPTEDGLFDKDLSHEQEVNQIDLLLNGKVLLTGSKASVLEDWLFSHKWSGERHINRLDGQGLVGYIFNKYVSEVTEEVCKIITDIGVDSVLALEGLSIYVSEPIKELKIPMGYFSVVSGADEVDMLLDSPSNLLGYTGEAYTQDYLEEEGIAYVGLPIKLYKDGLYFYAYDKEQTMVESTTWFKDNDVSFTYDSETITNPFKDSSSLPYKLVKALELSRGKFYIGRVSCSSKELNSALAKVIKKGEIVWK